MNAIKSQMTFKLAGDFIQIKSFDFHHYQTDLICCLILSELKFPSFLFLSTQLSAKYVQVIFHEIINLQYVIKNSTIFQLNITKVVFVFKTIEQFLILKVEANKMKKKISKIQVHTFKHVHRYINDDDYDDVHLIFIVN